MASVRKRGERQWEARVRRRGFPVTCKTFDIKAEAEAWARDVESEMDKGAFVTRKEAEGTTLKELLQRYLEEHVPLLADPKREGNRVKALQGRTLALRILSTIRSVDITNFIKEREKEGVGGNTIRLDLALLSRVFNLAASNWGMESLTNPVEKISKPKVDRGRVRRLEDGEWEKLLEVAPPPFRLVLRFALESAMRREEIASLRWKHVSIEKRTAHLPRTKNGDSRTVPLSSVACSILDGTVIAWPVSSNPEDADKWLECNGQTISQAVYPELFAVVGGNVPDFRGLFLRGVGGNSAGIGVAQDDTIKSHTVSSIGSPDQGVLHKTGGPIILQGAFFGTGMTYDGDITLQYDGDVETRPVNRAVRYLIRAKP